MEFPGTIVDNVFRFPALEYTDSKGKRRVLRLYVRLLKESRGFNNPNWNVMEEPVLKFKKEYLAGTAIPENSVAQYWSEYGIVGGKITLSSPKYPKPKNVGKKNERNSLVQAMTMAHADYIKRNNESVVSDDVGNNPLLFPMLASEYDGAKVKYPAYCQAKLDGMRCISFIGDNVQLYSRGLKMWPNSPTLNRIRGDLEKALKHAQIGDRSVYLDGELYLHGSSLQNINSLRSSDFDGEMNYYVFDIFDWKNPRPFGERLDQLLALKGHFGPNIKIVETICAENAAQEEEYYGKCMARGYEGIIVRNSKGIYEFSANKTSIRSKDLMKRKPLYDAEFEVIGFDQGTRGRDIGAVIWICSTVEGREFHVTPKDTSLDERRALYEDCVKHFKKKYQGRMLKVEYRDLSDADVPLRAKGIGFRDQE